MDERAAFDAEFLEANRKFAREMLEWAEQNLAEARAELDRLTEHEGDPEREARARAYVAVAEELVGSSRRVYEAATAD